MHQYLRRLRKRSQGQGVLEFALILMLVGLAAAAIIFILGPTIGNVFSNFIADAPVAPPSLNDVTRLPTSTPAPTATNRTTASADAQFMQILAKCT